MRWPPLAPKKESGCSRLSRNEVSTASPLRGAAQSGQTPRPSEQGQSQHAGAGQHQRVVQQRVERSWARYRGGRAAGAAAAAAGAEAGAARRARRQRRRAGAEPLQPRAAAAARRRHRGPPGCAAAGAAQRWQAAAAGATAPVRRRGRPGTGRQRGAGAGWPGQRPPRAAPGTAPLSFFSSLTLRDSSATRVAASFSARLRAIWSGAGLALHATLGQRQLVRRGAPRPACCPRPGPARGRWPGARRLGGGGGHAIGQAAAEGVEVARFAPRSSARASAGATAPACSAVGRSARRRRLQPVHVVVDEGIRVAAQQRHQHLVERDAAGLCGAGNAACACRRPAP